MYHPSTRGVPGSMTGQAARTKSWSDALRRSASSAVSGRFVRRSRSSSKRSNACFSDVLNACFSDVLSDPAIEVLVAHPSRVILDALDVAAVLGAAFEEETVVNRHEIGDVTFVLFHRKIPDLTFVWNPINTQDNAVRACGRGDSISPAISACAELVAQSIAHFHGFARR